ncbi:hypothetical protein JNB71_19095 [Rhizobium herbae]|uniref:Uncharacterized protein n=1 Tax=Rhizobium herbae TaxID=508661 RepID=A0ABS7HGQ2_9HYPH|nr:hypothetical protein [Rhizobium herbae]MBW9065413.1 hypothetical protein [Rhizobium herbae]
MRGRDLEILAEFRLDLPESLNTPIIPIIYEKVDFFEIELLTSFEGWDYKPLTNEGGGAAGDRRTRSEVSLGNCERIWG